MYGRELDGVVTTFGTTSYAYNDVFLLYDRATKSVWYPLSEGAFDAVGGPMRGRQILYLDSPPVAKLRDWLAQHPDWLVLIGDALADG